MLIRSPAYQSVTTNFFAWFHPTQSNSCCYLIADTKCYQPSRHQGVQPERLQSHISRSEGVDRSRSVSKATPVAASPKPHPAYKTYQVSLPPFQLFLQLIHNKRHKHLNNICLLHIYLQVALATTNLHSTHRGTLQNQQNISLPFNPPHIGTSQNQHNILLQSNSRWGLEGWLRYKCTTYTTRSIRRSSDNSWEQQRQHNFHALAPITASSTPCHRLQLRSKKRKRPKRRTCTCSFLTKESNSIMRPSSAAGKPGHHAVYGLDTNTQPTNQGASEGAVTTRGSSTNRHLVIKTSLHLNDDDDDLERNCSCLRRAISIVEAATSGETSN